MKTKRLLALILFYVTSLFLSQSSVQNNNKKNQIKKSTEITKEKKISSTPFLHKKQKNQKYNTHESEKIPEVKDSTDQESKKSQVIKDSETIIPLSFYILNINQGEIIAKQRTSDSQKIKLPWTETRAYLANYLLEDYLKKLESKVTIEEGNESWISVTDLNTETMKTYFLETDLSIRVTPDFISVKAEKVSLKDDEMDPEAAKNYVHPSAISGYQNMNLNEAFRSGSSENSSYGRQKYNLRHDGAINIKDWIIQNEGSSIQEGSEYKRGDIKLVHDDVSHMIRYSAGDVAPPGGGFLDSALIFGVGASREYSLKPTYNYSQVSSYIITVKKNATIKILSNKILIQNMSKLAGKYDIRDFPVLLGLNEVELEIVYDDGEIERLQIPSFNYSPDLLGEGQNNFNYYAGVPQSQLTHIKDTNNHIIEAADKYGISNKVTVGAYTQTTRNFSIFGGSLDYASSIGTIRLENAISHRFFDQNFGIGTRFSYQYSKGPSSFNLFVERRGFGFYTFANVMTQDPNFYRIASNYSQKIDNKTSASISESYGLSKDQGVKNPLDLILGFNRSISSDFQLSSLLKKTIGLINDTSITLQLSWRLSDAKTIASSYNSAGNSVSATLNDKLGKDIDEQVGVSSGQDQKIVSGRLSHLGERANTSISTDETFLSNGNRSGNSSLDLSTTVAFAGSAVTITSPISNSFVLVKSEGKLKKEKISINENRSSNIFGPASLTNLTSYQENTVNINSNDLRQGLTLKKDTYTVVPTYKSGILIELETESFVSIHGTLVDENNKPLALTSGKITNSANKSKEEFFFTNETGEFFIERLESVDYDILLFNKTGSKFPVHVPANFEGVFDCGQLVIKTKIDKAGN